MSEQKKLATFYEKNPDAELTGFWWCAHNGDYSCVVLASTKIRSSRKCEAAEFSGATPQKLIEAMQTCGFEPGEGVDVARMCESAPCSPTFRRRVRP